MRKKCFWQAAETGGRQDLLVKNTGFNSVLFQLPGCVCISYRKDIFTGFEREVTSLAPSFKMSLVTGNWTFGVLSILQDKRDGKQDSWVPLVNMHSLGWVGPNSCQALPIGVAEAGASPWGEECYSYSYSSNFQQHATFSPRMI